MLIRLRLPRRVAAVALLSSLALLTSGGAAAPVRAALDGSFVTICRLYHDPTDKFTRVMPPASARGMLRSSAFTSVITVNYGSGFTTEAQTAFQTAIDIWRTQINSPVPIVVDAQYQSLGSTLLGLAGFRNVFSNFPGAPLANVFYPVPIANKLSGVDRDVEKADISITLNSSANWSYAIDGVPVAGKPDFVSAVLHELGHGLGFAGSASINSITGLGQIGLMGRPYVFDTNAADSANTGIVDASVYPAGSVALANLIKGTGVAGPGLFWKGANGMAANGGARPRLYAPSTYQVGFSYSHLDDATYPPGNVNSLMTPSLGNAEIIHTMGPITNGMMADMGWGTQCSFGLSFTQINVPAAGGQVMVSLSTSAGCNWTASTAASFVTVNPANISGTQSALVRMTVAANAGSTPRVATVQIADQTLTIAQAGSTPCGFTLNPPSASIGGAGGPATVDLTASHASCGWTAIANPAEATITNPADGVQAATVLGLGSATITYTVKPNPVCSPRTVTLSIGGQSFSITQAPAPPSMTIDTTTLRFGAVSSSSAFVSQTSSQTARLVQNGPGTVTWTAASSSPWLVVSPTSGTGAATLTISTQFAPGLVSSQTGTVTVTYSGASNTTGSVSSTLTILPTQASAPFGAFDTPLDGTGGVVGSIPVTGWALDDVEVTRVRIMRDPVAGEPSGALVFVGNADLVEGARPDVQSQFLGVPRSSRAGWGYLMLTNFLPNLGNGTFRLTAIAEDADGHATVLGTRTITVTNATATTPFGAIDTPTQGGTASGTLVNFGWVLAATPRLAAPPDGGTVQIVVDGAFLPQVPTGWVPRPDLTELFPANVFPGVARALAVAAIDTTTMTNAVHTIAWVVTDTSGAAAGIGSRYFTVANLAPPTNGTCGTSVTSGPDVIPASRAAQRVRGGSLSGRLGYIQDAPFRRFEADAQGLITIRSEEIDRIELDLGPGADGHLVVAGELRPMPAGSRIDPITGRFTWQPGVGFVGSYDFILAGHEVRIVLEPKRSGGPSGPQVVIDLPSADAREVPARSFIVAGWAADLDSTIDGGVDTVHVWAYPVIDGRQGHPIFLGPATFGGPRPDVALVYGDRFGRSGYGLEVTSLQPGTYDVAVFAYSTVRGGFVPAKTVRVTVR